MAALTKDRNTPTKGSGFSISIPVKANTKIYKGSLVACIFGTTGAQPAGDTASSKVMGVAEHQADNTGGAEGAILVRLRCNQLFKFEHSGVVATDVGKKALVADDQTVQDAATTNNIEAGIIAEVDPDDGKPWVLVTTLASK
jgi:hypothetical protein